MIAGVDVIISNDLPFESLSRICLSSSQDAELTVILRKNQDRSSVRLPVLSSRDSEAVNREVKRRVEEYREGMPAESGSV